MTNYERLLELLKVDGYDDCGLRGCEGMKEVTITPDENSKIRLSDDRVLVSCQRAYFGEGGNENE